MDTNEIKNIVEQVIESGFNRIADAKADQMEICNYLMRQGLASLKGSLQVETVEAAASKEERKIPHTDARHMIGCSIQTINDWIKKGRIEATEDKMISIKEVERMEKIFNKR